MKSLAAWHGIADGHTGFSQTKPKPNDTSYDLIQFLIGHGGFRKYHFRFRFDESPDCPTCKAIAEDAEYIFFNYPRFESSSRNFEIERNIHLPVQNLVRRMVQSNAARETDPYTGSYCNQHHTKW